MTLFIDGAPSGSNDLGSPQDVNNATDLVLGSSPCVDALAGTNFTGVVDELRFADSADPNLLLPPVPVNLAAPTIPAAAQDGDTLTCAPGDWRYHPTFTFQWLRDGQPIGGATSAAYTATADDVGHGITCRVKGSNAGGEATADSNGVTPAAKPVATTPPPTTPPATTPPVITAAADRHRRARSGRAAVGEALRERAPLLDPSAQGPRREGRVGGRVRQGQARQGCEGQADHRRRLTCAGCRRASSS